MEIKIAPFGRRLNVLFNRIECSTPGRNVKGWKDFFVVSELAQRAANDAGATSRRSVRDPVRRGGSDGREPAGVRQKEGVSRRGLAVGDVVRWPDGKVREGGILCEVPAGKPFETRLGEAPVFSRCHG